MGTKRKVFIPLAITLILVIAFVCAWACISKNDYVLKINGQKITMNEFNPYFTLQKKTMEAQAGENIWNMLINDAPAIETARDNAKQSIINTTVRLQQARARKLFLTGEEKKEIRDYASSLTEQLKDYEITVEEFAKMNEDVALMDKLAIALYKEQDHSTHSHGKIDIESYENGVESSLGVTKYNSRHILFSTKDMSDADAEKVKAKAEAVLTRIKNGEDFATLAGEYSDDPGSKENGGLYEDVELGQFVSEYEKAVLSINSGEVYPELVKSEHGYHIIKSEGVENPDGVLSLEMAETVISNELDEAARDWVLNAEVEVNEQRYNSAQ